jgi:hypothetical protein
VREQVFAASVGRDEAKAFSIVEPFDDTGFHILDSLGSLIKTGEPFNAVSIIAARTAAGILIHGLAFI